MISVYPYASGSFYTASYAITSSFANSAQFIARVTSASNAATVQFPESGSRGKGICLLTIDQYLTMIATNRVENCEFQ